MSKAPLKNRIVVLLSCLLALIFIATSALAAGRIQWKSNSFKERESSKSWRLELAIYLPKPPDTAYVPMKFEFMPVAYYERSMVDGDKLVERTVPLSNNQPLIENVDVGFLDPGTAQIMSRTKFTFKVTRAHDYAAGEYKVTVSDARTGKKIGVPTTLKFLGENEVIDRRSIVFSGEKKKKKKDDAEDKSGEGEEASGDAADGAEDGGEDDAEDNSEHNSEHMDLQDDDGDSPPPVEKKPGCGCRIPGAPGSGTPLGALSLVALGLILMGRRRG